jgi:hypothetical protein
MNTHYTTLLKTLHAEALANYQSGCRTPDTILSPESSAALVGLGLTNSSLYDCVDDFSRYGAPDLETFLGVAGLRVACFGGVQTNAEIPESDLPRKSDSFDGVAWLPRIIRKAECFLEGTLCRDVMYGCSGDRAFLAKYDANLPGFLQAVLQAKGDPASVLRYLKDQAST